ncbi:MAG TPA: 16S rRNA (cytosine(967)-C(5))-methyltransferase RsmB [Candidatus Binatia bacterium]|nr:16S rRNA (cytosine(967)-C(5))-methyltransferase RsmB [Candidatus Binatia bacterium]
MIVLAEAKSVRALAADILRKVDVEKAYADMLLDHALRSQALRDADRALLTELVYGTLRWRGRLDALLSPQLDRPLEKTDPVLRNLLRLAAYQLLFLDRIPAYAAVNEAVALAKSLRGAKAAGFANAVLRNVLRKNSGGKKFADGDDSVTALAAAYSHPEWLVKKWLEEFGPAEIKPLLQANNQKAPLVLRANSLKIARGELLRRFSDAGIQAAPTERSPQGVRLGASGAVEKLPGFNEGLFQVQAESSQLVAYLLAPSPGERILDACAAPGGKSTHIAELMQDEGEVVAIDSSARGVKKIVENATRLGLKSVRAVRADARTRLSGLKLASFDRILVDAPCSGLGTLRAHPEIKWQRSESDVERLRRLQVEILEHAARYLKPGGVLVYSTCTLTREENQQVVEGFLGRTKSFELEPAAGYLPEQAQPMARGEFFLALPHRDDTDGFFAARMRKAS